MHKYWERVTELIDLNIKRLGVENFMNFQEVHATMLVLDKNLAEEELAYIKEKAYLNYDELLKDEVLGDYHPQKIHSLYHLFKFIENGGKVPKTGSIVEIGPGVGCMIDILKKVGFKGTYFIIDSPVLNKIQQYYLQKNGSLDSVEFQAPKLNKISMLIGTWSISEIPLENRLVAEYNASQYLLAYGDVFNGEVDNRNYFKEFSDSRENVKWATVPIRGEQKYLFGVKNESNSRRKRTKENKEN